MNKCVRSLVCLWVCILCVCECGWVCLWVCILLCLWVCIRKPMGKREIERESECVCVGEPQNAKMNKILLWSKLDLIGKTVSCSYLSSPRKRPLYFISEKNQLFMKKRLPGYWKRVNRLELFSTQRSCFHPTSHSSIDLNKSLLIVGDIFQMTFNWPSKHLGKNHFHFQSIPKLIE